MPAYADNIIHADATRKTPSRSNSKTRLEQKPSDEDVVVSGMSGRFPESSSVREFAKNLYEGVDMVTEDDRRWLPGLYGLPRRSGKLPDLSHFDAAFFSVSPRQAHCMDPQLRLLLEVSHEAIFDAGLHPNALRGKRVGVYVGVSGSETEEFITGDPDQITGYELTGCCRAMFANRLSYALDLKGPSFAVDTACSSALVAFQTAWSAISEGEIDAALVAGSNLTLKPQSSLQFHSLSMLSPDGRCKAFDQKANGYVRSEAVTAVFLQRRKDAIRVYGHVVQALTNTDGFKGEGITFPSGEVQKALLQEVYDRAGVDPCSVSYVEAHGTGTKAGDPQELNAIADIFCKNRSEPLMIGSVKTNMGHSEPASGLCALIKVLLSIQNREIPGNLHFESPNPDIDPLNDGRLKVVSENTPWRGNFAAVNCFGFGGANVHVLIRTSEASTIFPNSEDYLLRSISSDSDSSMISSQRINIIPEGGVPRLVLSMGRTLQNVNEILEEFHRNRNVDFASLLDSINESDASAVSYPYRGYTVVGGGSDRRIMNATDCPSEKKPLWLIFSGMGSQWRGCGRSLLELPPFDEVIQKCRSALLPLGIDVLDIITREEPDPMASTTNSFTAIAAVQVGLVEVLKSVGLTKFDGLVGHSVGELGCGYADGALTAEQTVLAAYWRGKAVEEAGLPVGAMAAVGLSAEDAEKFIKKGSDVVVACRNSAASVTISGPKDEIELVKERLDAEGVFCRSVDSGGIAFHHSSLRKAAPRLLAELQKVILTPIRRSSRWVSSSVPEAKWGNGIAQKASPEYLVNNLVSPVLFAEALTKIPEGARVVEVSPHALMQAVLRRALPSSTMIPLVRKESKDVLSHLLESLGKLYVTGEKISLRSLYSAPKVPIPANTPSVGHLIKWDHSVEWDVAKFGSSSKSEFKLEVDLNDSTLSFLEGHTIDGRVLFPATGYMTLAWRALAKLVDKKWEELPVTFQDVVLHQATVLSNNSTVSFIVRLLLKKGEFEVLAGETVAASGKIEIGVKDSSERKVLMEHLQKASKKSPHFELTHGEVYKELSLRGYHYSGDFRGIKTSDIEGTTGELMWKKNWIPLLDTLLQFSLLGSPSKGLYLPTRIRRVHVEPSKFYPHLNTSEEVPTIPVTHSRTLGVTTCPGVEIYGLKATMAPRKSPSDNPVLEGYQFYPNNLETTHQLSNALDMEKAAYILMDNVIENSSSIKIRLAHYLDNKEKLNNSLILSRSLIKRFDVYPILAVDYKLNTYNPLIKDEFEEFRSLDVDIVDELDPSTLGKLNLFVISQESLDEKCVGMVANLSNGSFILVDDEKLKKEMMDVGLVEVVSIQKFNLHLLRKPCMIKDFDTLVIDGSDADFSWVETLKEKILADNEKEILWLISRGNRNDGLLGMVKCLRKEPGGERLRCIVDPDDIVTPDSPIWNKIIRNNMVYNIIVNQTLGIMKHLPLPEQERTSNGYSYLNVLTRGDLSSLTWLTGPAPSDQDDNLTLGCSVAYAPLNFRDIMLASGKLPPDALPGSVAQKECILGLEFAGVSEEGKRVMGLVTAGGLATWIQADPYLVWDVPQEWSLKEAATVPVVYATAYYALVVRGDLQPGESVLIHAGSGGVGQAAISIALSRGCTVYTTVSTEKKRNFLKERFPQLSEKNFANSRDSTFEYHILEETEGQGVDLVLNSLAGELLQASVRCLKEHGRFLEIGKADLANNTALGMAIFLKNVTFHGILLDSLFEGSVARKQQLQKVLYDGIASGEVKPLPSTVFTNSQVEEAFRFMASGKHIGKVLLEIVSDDRAGCPNKGRSKRKCTKIPEHQATNTTTGLGISSVYRFWPKPNMVYVITGGLGGLGLELADWLLRRGARKLVLTSRRGVATGYQALCVKRWTSSGAHIRVLKQDASTAEGAEALLTESSKDGPIGGIFHLAVVLEDSILENQSSEKFQRVCRVKADGAKYMDEASRKLCHDLHLWVTFSSVACGKGNAGQCNYGWANSVSERVVERRVADGLPGCAIQWGGIADVGVLASTLGNVEVAGTKPQSLRSVLACLDDLLGSKIPVVGSVCLSSKKSSSQSGKSTKSLIASLANILGIRDISKAPMNVSLGDLGMDSLMAVEIKQTLEREADIVLTAEQIRELTIARIQDLESQKKPESFGPTSNAVESAPTEEKSFETFSWLDFPLVASEVLRCLNSHDSRPQNSSTPPLFIAAPIQGTCDVLVEVSSEVKTRVIGLEYTADLPTTDIAQLASTLIEKLEQYLPEGPFYLGGYSYGASVAFEIACQLQTKGRLPLSLLLLDGSHSYVSGIIGTYRSKYSTSRRQQSGAAESSLSTKSNSQKDTEREIISRGESDALATYALQFCSVDALKLRNSLMQLPSFTERLDFIADTIVNHVKKSKKATNLAPKEVKLSASLFYDRLVASVNREPSTQGNISLETLLVRAAQNTHLQNFGSDYGLSKVIDGHLEVKECQGTHESFILGPRAKNVAQHINEFLVKTLPKA